MKSEAGPARSRLPIAALLSVALLLISDHLVLGPGGPWPFITAQVPLGDGVSKGVARDRVQLQMSRARPAEEKSVFVVGTSRARAGFQRRFAMEVASSLSFFGLTHAMLDPFVTLSLAPEIVEAGADVVVLYLSDFDTHRPLRIDPIPAKSSNSPHALVEVFANAGPAFAFENRTLLYRITVSSWLHSYRFRDLLAQTPLSALRAFPLPRRLVERSQPTARGPAVLESPFANSLSEVERARFVARLPTELKRHAVRQLPFLTEIQKGEHSRIGMGIVRRTVTVFRDSGVEVLIVECPLHESRGWLRDAGTRPEFLSLGRSLAEQEGVHFLPLEALPNFQSGDFSDLLHLNQKGANRLTAALVTALEEIATN